MFRKVKSKNGKGDNHRTMLRCASVKMNDILHFLVRDKMITVWSRAGAGDCFIDGFTQDLTIT